MKSIRNNRTWRGLKSATTLAASLGLVFAFGNPAAAADSLCATVKIEIQQELTLERQAFDAHMRINNGIAHIALEDVRVVVTFADVDGNMVTATSDPNNTNALFFIRIDSMENIGDVSGTGRVAPSTSADIHWLIIPAFGAGGAGASGVRYLVGARLTYRIGSDPQVMDVVPDSIVVRPMPMLELDYFLPGDVYGDDAFTLPVEPPVPFALGVRVKNSGRGVARSVRIDSGRPKIVENELGLLIGFSITGSEVNGGRVSDSLLVNFGDIAPASAGIARWIMECSLSGRFVEFGAHYSHADELGGILTSLIRDPINTHLLVHDVLVDLPGRDGIRDFLALDGTALKVYESDNTESVVVDLSASAAITCSNSWCTVSTTTSAGLSFIRLTDPLAGMQQLRSAIRSDGKSLNPANAWLSRMQDRETHQWSYFVNVFDADNITGLPYILQFGAAPGHTNLPPRITVQPQNRTNQVGTSASFIVEVTGDPPFNYQWLRNGSLLPGKTNVSLEIYNVQPSDGGNYRVLVSNLAATTPSRDAYLKVLVPPWICPVSTQYLIVGRQLVITNCAVDDDEPITFSLGLKPAGATITTNGVFRWTPACNQGSSTTPVQVWATDSGIPPASNSMTFAVIVAECVEASLGNTVMQAGTTSSVPVRLLSTTALTNMAFTVVYPPERLTNITLTVNSPQVLTQWLQWPTAGQVEVSFTLPADSVLHGPTNVGELGFTALPGQPSAFVPLPITDVAGLKPDGEPVGNAYGYPGRVIVVGQQPLLEAVFWTNSQPALLLYALPHTTNWLETTPSLNGTVPWAFDRQLPVTGALYQVIQPILTTNRTLFFRAVR